MHPLTSNQSTTQHGIQQPGSPAIIYVIAECLEMDAQQKKGSVHQSTLPLLFIPLPLLTIYDQLSSWHKDSPPCHGELACWFYMDTLSLRSYHSTLAQKVIPWMCIFELGKGTWNLGAGIPSSPLLLFLCCWCSISSCAWGFGAWYEASSYDWQWCMLLCCSILVASMKTSPDQAMLAH